MPQSPHHNSRKPTSLVVIAVLLVAVGIGWYYRQNISDWYRLRGYTPSAAITTLADQTTMTDEGRRIFYTTHPEVANKDGFNSQCRQGSASEYSIVLGCYVSSGTLYGNIYLYDVQDERLLGVKQVTAAHEMLHAAYDRLSDSERRTVDAQLMEAYKNLPEGRIKETIAQYEAADPSSVPSELHSILGTEQRDLPKGLETYYKRYFTNRQAIVAFSEDYEEEFTNRQQSVAEYDAQLASLKAQIDSSQAEADRQYQSLQQARIALDRFEASGDIAAFNARVSSYNQQVASYNALAQQLRSDIDEYNRLVIVRNNVASEFQELTNAIDSRPQTL